MGSSEGRSLAFLFLSCGFAAGGFGLAPPAALRTISPGALRHPAARAPPPLGRAQSSGRRSPRTNGDGVLSARSGDAVPDGGGPVRPPGERRWRRYFSTMRPVTILQAVGAFLVGRLVVLSRRRGDADRAAIASAVAASLSIYLGYGAGMAMNDCADADVDSRHETKRARSLASDAISVRSGWLFCAGISIVSVGLAWLADWIGGGGRGTTGGIGGVGGFVGWSLLNLALMAGYALGMQRVFLVKNLLCGFFAVSPLLGASLLGGSTVLERDVASKLCQLAAVGFPLQVSREILKDIEDVDVDRGEKRTLPLAIGEANSKRIAYGLVAAVNAGMVASPYYWRMFRSNPPVYAASVALGTPMCVAASRLPLVKGQRLLKKSIYVLLSGMISGLLIQTLQ